MPDAPEARYRAFISYSHADAGFGRRLHRRLETYAVPARLVGRATARGPVPRRLSPIFRDREELPADGDLSTQVRAALGQSAALVVVCSPRAAVSPWVGREVALFRELHPDRPVLAALIEGEPAEAFPAVLSEGGAEPLAADFREGRDGERLGLLKLVAGVIGVGLDELIQRDAQRNLRRVTAVTAGALVGMVAMGGLAAFAFNARAEAERQRAEAEGLVEFMMTDLRARLSAETSLDVLTAANRRALAYYEHQDLKGLAPRSLLRRTEIITAMGQDDMRRNELDRALAQFREARRTTAALLAADPADPDRIYAHAQSEYWVALVDWRRNNLVSAQAGMKRYAELTRRLIAIDPDKPEWRMEAGYAESNLGTLELSDPAGAARAEQAFVRSLSHFSAVAKAKARNPALDVDAAEVQADIADADGWIADTLRVQRRFGAARAARREEEAILRALLAADPKNKTYANALQFNAVSQARIDLEDGKAAEAAERLRHAWADSVALSDADPSDAERAMQRVVTGLFYSEAALAAGQAASEARRGLAGCDEPVARADSELRDFCKILTARFDRATGPSDTPSVQYVRAHRNRLASVRRSQRWGIDFNQELID